MTQSERTASPADASKEETVIVYHFAEPDFDDPRVALAYLLCRDWKAPAAAELVRSLVVRLWRQSRLN